MFLVVIAILSIVLAFTRPLWEGLADGRLVAVAAAVATLLPPSVAALVSRRALRLLERRVDDPTHGQSALARGNLLVQIMLGLCHGALLLCTDWSGLCGSTPVVGKWPVVPTLLIIAPFVLSLVLVWVALYPADRAVRQIALEVYLFRGRPVRPVWSLAQYVVYNLRHQLLFILIPMLLILAARDVIYIYARELHERTGSPYFADVLLGAAAVIVALIAPVILRYVWSTRRLPDGPLRDRLQVLCRTLGVRCREILVWRAGGMVVNAAVMGVVAPLRYVLITDGMLEQLEDTRIEAVFGHEAGHVKQHHIFFFLLFALISGCAVTIFSIRTQGLETQSLPFQIAAVAVGLGIVVKWGLIFGWISRRFERQADIFGVRTLALSGLPCNSPCKLHAPEEENPGPSAKRNLLCSTAAHVFGDTLNEVAVLNGIAPEGRSWRHGSISSRSRMVQALAQDPAATARVERTARNIKLVIFACALVSSAWAAFELRIWQLCGLHLFE